MRRPLSLLASLAVLIPAAAFATGCGSEDLDPVSVADATAATREAETARIELSMEIKGAGMPTALTFTGEGVTAMEGVRMDVTFDLGPLLSSFGAGGDGKTRVLVDGGDVFVDPPEIQGLDLPGDATWVTADVAEIAEAAGIDAEGVGELVRLSTEQQLDALEAAGSVKEVGEEEIDGEKTVHLKGTISLNDYLEALPAERRARAEKLIEQVEALPGGDLGDLNEPTPIELWVDGEDRVRRIRQSAEIPAQKGVPGGSFDMTMDYSDFGTDLDIDRPGGDEVWDATGQVTKALPARPAP